LISGVIFSFVLSAIDSYFSIDKSNCCFKSAC